MYIPIKDRLKIRKLRLVQKKINKSCNRDIEIAKNQKKDPNEIEGIRQYSYFEYSMIEEEISEIISNHLISIARKKIIPIPDYKDSEMWFQGEYRRRKILTEKGISQLRLLIREENQTWFRKNIISIFALIIASSSAYFSYTQSEIAEASMKYANRPYIIVSGIKQFQINKFGFKISNFGATPSYYTKIYYDIFIGDTSFVPPKEFGKINNLIPVIGGNVKGSNVYFESDNMFLPDTLEKLERLNKFIYCAGQVEYQDIFKDKHGYFFCFKKTTDPGFYKYKDYNFAF